MRSADGKNEKILESLETLELKFYFISSLTHDPTFDGPYQDRENKTNKKWIVDREENNNDVSIDINFSD